MTRKTAKPASPCASCASNWGLTSQLPAFEGDASEVREANQQNLASCDVVFVFYGAGDAAWKRTIDNELRKMAGYRGGKSLPPIFTYLAEPRTPDKQDLIDMEEPGLIDGLGGFAEAAMTKSLQREPSPERPHEYRHSHPASRTRFRACGPSGRMRSTCSSAGKTRSTPWSTSWRTRTFSPSLEHPAAASPRS